MPLPSYHDPRVRGQTRGPGGSFGGSSTNLQGGSSGNLYQSQAASGWASGGGRFGASSAYLDDPENALDGQQVPQRRGSILGVFSEGLKKSWTSLGSITTQAAAAMMGSSGLGRSHEDISSPYRAQAAHFDEESGGSSAQGSYGTEAGGQPATLPGGLNYLAAPRGSVAAGTSDQHLLPRHSRGYGTQGDNRRGSGILPS
ncbi:hypothetical protein HDU87_002898 [Geranomyces variabilis]|uniref:Uncharacterized protein n=1 Tax=Geranomyces variabilis TaxID=109894 RepID=A0AAD5TL42_9FUNG|nr:hypothetical protein HDU87_002898 [Geranomyces variabilis]